MSSLRRFLRRRLHPLKLALVALVFVTFLFLIQWEVGDPGQREEQWLPDGAAAAAVKRGTVLDMVMGAVNNIREDRKSVV